jgi:hypothetical protein
MPPPTAAPVIHARVPNQLTQTRFEPNLKRAHRMLFIFFFESETVVVLILVMGCFHLFFVLNIALGGYKIIVG